MTATTVIFKFAPQDHVTIPTLSCKGRVARCLVDGGPQPLYGVDFIVNGDCKRNEFYEDELDGV